MISILVVDDEVLIRQSILKMLTTHYGEQINLYNAENGLKAIELISAISIDIIISDIKMPICNGIEMLRKLKNMNYAGDIIILSGFDDYDLVRDALKLGATDYLLKPLQNSEFFNLLDGCTKRAIHRELYHTQFPTETIYSEGNLYEQQYTLEQLISNDSSTLSAYSSYSHCLMVFVDIFYQKPFSKGALKKAYLYEVENHFSAFSKSECTIIQGESDNLWLIVLFCQEYTDFSCVNSFMNKCKDRQIKVSSSSLFLIDELSNAYKQGLRKLDSCYFDLPSIVPTHPEAFPYPKQMEKLIDYIYQFEFIPSCNILQNLFYNINAEKPPVVEIRRLFTDFIYSIMQKNNSYIKIIGKYKLTENDIVQIISNSFSLSHLKKDFIRIFDIYMKEARENSIQKDEYYIRKAKEYIDHEFRNDINLNSLSQHLSIHPNYCSAIFKKKSGMTYLAYLRKVRIKEACRLMETTNMKLYEIAEKVGYHDTVHLNRAFQKETGRPPSLYNRRL